MVPWGSRATSLRGTQQPVSPAEGGAQCIAVHFLLSQAWRRPLLRVTGSI